MTFRFAKLVITPLQQRFFNLKHQINASEAATHHLTDRLTYHRFVYLNTRDALTAAQHASQPNCMYM